MIAGAAPPRARRGREGDAAVLLARFVHASDLHLGAPPEANFALAAARRRQLLAEVADVRPDWLVLSGDLTHHGSVRPEELQASRTELEGLGIPYNTVAGNHDLCPSPEEAANFPGIEVYEPGPLGATVWGRTFGAEGVHFRHRLGPVEFLGVSLRGGDPDGELGWLTEALGRPAPGARARVVVGHYPVRPVRGEGPLKTWGPGHLGTAAQALGRVLADAAQGPVPVVAYLFGHVHVLAAELAQGVWHATPGAVGAGCPGYRVGEIWEDRIELRFVPLGIAELAECRFWSAGNPSACADELHPDYQSYHGGNAAERALTIPLPVRTPG